MHEQASIKRRHSSPRLPGWLWLALSLVLSLAWVQSPAQSGNVRIGYVDMKHLFDNAPQVIAVRELLDQEFRPRNEALLADEVRLDLLRQNLTDARETDAETRFDMEREIRNLQRSIDRRREDLSEELRFRTNTEKKALEETIEVAVRQVAERGGFALILTSPVAYAAPSINVTDQILEWLETDFRNQSAGNRR